MKNISICLLLLTLFPACQSSGSRSRQDNTDSKSKNIATSPRVSNAVVEKMPARLKSKKWESLFNGKNMAGWRGFKNKATDAWDVEEGALHCNGHKKNAAHTDLITNKKYKNFLLSIKWKISPESNSGIMFHVSEDQAQTYLTGPEYQIIDDKGWPGKLEGWQHTGSNYAMQVPNSDSIQINPVGEWNTTEILVNGTHVEHWLNGKKILQYELWSPEWEEQKASGKWKDVPSYGMSKTGHIALQYHGGDVWFKDIKIKKI